MKSKITIKRPKAFLNTCLKEHQKEVFKAIHEASKSKKYFIYTPIKSLHP